MRPNRTLAVPVSSSVSRRGHLASGLLLWSLGLAACAADGPTDPAESPASIRIDLSVTQLDPPSITESQSGLAIITCRPELSAFAKGSGRATWLDATFKWYVGRDRSVAVDSAIVAAPGVQKSWGRMTIGADESQTSLWDVSASVPYAMTIDYRYQPDAESEVKTAIVTFTCGPEASADAPPPEVTSIEIRAPAGEVAPADTLVITYSATSEVGLWQTFLVLSGPCVVDLRFMERLASSVTRTALLPIPADCTVGEPVALTVIAVDALLDEHSRAVTTDIVVGAEAATEPLAARHAPREHDRQQVVLMTAVRPTVQRH